MHEEEGRLIPVELLNNFYVVSEDWLTAQIPFPRVSEGGRLVTRGYTRKDGIVHFEGRARPAVILQPPDNCDQYFAELSAEDRLYEGSQIDEVDPGDLEAYWFKLLQRYGRSEGVLPEQCTEISTGFVEPRLALAHLDGKSIEWGHLREKSYLLISGAPGSGKTTLLRQWLLWHAEHNRIGRAERLPLCLALRNFKPEDTIEQALQREAEITGARWLARDLLSFAERGELAIAFDGVDEIPIEDRGSAINNLAKFANKFPNCKYIVTTRPGINVDFDVGLVHANLLPLDTARLRQIIYCHLHGHGSWKGFATRVEAEPALSLVIKNPLALTFIIARYLRHEIRPSFVSEIIHKVVEMFVDSWDSSRGIVRTRRHTLSPAVKHKLLARVAQDVGYKDVIEMPLLNFSEKEERLDSILNLIGEHTGLIKSEPRGGWAFKDRTIEDYFRAVTWVSALVGKAGEFRKLLSRPLSSSRSSLASFVAFMSSDAEKQISEVLRKISEPELATAVRLTNVIDQGLPLKKSTLYDYANLVANVLDGPLIGAHDPQAAYRPGLVFVCKINFSPTNEFSTDGLDELVASLHRARDGIGAEAIRAVIHKTSRQHLKIIEKLLNADGELHVEKNVEGITWIVESILPNVSSGSKHNKETSSRTMH